jgi:hypothetical protein
MSSRLEITWQCPMLVLLDTSQAVRSGRSTFNDRFPRCERREWVESDRLPRKSQYLTSLYFMNRADPSRDVPASAVCPFPTWGRERLHGSLHDDG